MCVVVADRRTCIELIDESVLQKMWLKTRIAVTVLGVALFVFAFILAFVLVPFFIRKEIEETVKLVNGSDSYARWKDLPIPITYKIYFFVIENPDKVHQGEKPQFREVGPYIYTQERWKTNISAEEDTLSYAQKLQFKFDENASNPLSDTDEIHIVNLPLLATVAIAEIRLLPLLPMLDKAIDHIFGNPTDLFLRTTPRDFLFDGIFLTCDSVDALNTAACAIIEKLAPPTVVRLEDGRIKFSLLSHKNNTDDEGDFVINSGTKNIEELGQISSWKGSSTLSNWAENTICNNIVGSDSTIFPPFVTPESIINVYSTDICRSVTLEYSSDTTYSGIHGHKFIAGESMLASPSSRPSNQCYCLNKTKGIHGNDGCLLDGTLELWSCQQAPLVMTFPHFYLAADAYKNGVNGINSTQELHEMFVELEPNTGTPLRGHKRAQFNIFFREIPNITLTNGLKPTLMPVVWLDEGVDLPDDLIGELNQQLFDPLHKADITFWVLFSVGLVIIVINIGLAIVIIFKSKKHVIR